MLSVLISTVNNRFYRTRPQLHGCELVVVNQVHDEQENAQNAEMRDDQAVKYFSSHDVGLSRSRNVALSNADGDLCLLADDDIDYCQGFAEEITAAFDAHPEADIITFQVRTPEGQPYKRYSHRKKWHNRRSIMSVSSVEIAFRNASLANRNLCFDETFGLGSRFKTGEEVIFLHSALKQGLKILYYPATIVIHPRESSGKNYQDDELVKAKGALFYRLFGAYAYLLCGLFALKRAASSGRNHFVFYQLMRLGINEYKKYKHNKK